MYRFVRLGRTDWVGYPVSKIHNLEEDIIGFVEQGNVVVVAESPEDFQEQFYIDPSNVDIIED